MERESGFKGKEFDVNRVHVMYRVFLPLQVELVISLYGKVTRVVLLFHNCLVINMARVWTYFVSLFGQAWYVKDNHSCVIS